MTVRDARLPVALAVEALWSFAAAAVFVRLFGGGDGLAPSLAAIAAVVLAAFAVTRAPRAANVAETSARAAVIVASPVALFLILHTEYATADPPWRLDWAVRLITEPGTVLADHKYVVAGAVGAMLLWLRGIARWSAPIDSPDVLPVATLGFAAIALAAVTDPPVRGPHPFGLVALTSFVLVWCLLALNRTADADEPLAKFAARWGAAFAVVIAASVAFTLVLAAFDPRTLGFLEPIGATLVGAVGVVVVHTLGPVVAVVGFLFRLIPLHAPKQQQMPQPPASPLTNPESHTPYWVQVVGYVLAGGGVIVLVLSFGAAIWLAMRRYARRKTRVPEQRGTVERHGMFSEDLGALLDGIARRLRRPRAAQSSIEVRRLYYQMLARAEAEGLPRPTSATPLQFAPQLDARYGSGVPSAISSAFVSSRYGLVEFDADAVSDLRVQWKSLSHVSPSISPDLRKL